MLSVFDDTIVPHSNVIISSKFIFLAKKSAGFSPTLFDDIIISQSYGVKRCNFSLTTKKALELSNAFYLLKKPQLIANSF